jgi:hypothetical protein
MTTIEEITARTKAIAQVLNAAKSCGQAAAAIHTAEKLAASTLADFSTLTEGEVEAINVLRPALAASGRFFEGKDPASPVDRFTADWTRAKSFIVRVYVERAGIEGRLGALENVSFADGLAEAIANAPHVIGEAIGTVVGFAGETVGKLAGGAAGGLLSGLGFTGVLAVLVIGAIVVGVLVAKRKVIG